MGEFEARKVIDLSIVIVNWNTRDLLAKCLQSVLDEVCGLQGLNVETLVVDNASTDGSAQMVQDQFSWVRLIKNKENAGFARANNQAILQSKGRYVLLLNSDTEVFTGALESLIRFMEGHSRSGGCGPRLLNADGSLQVSCHPMLTPEREFWRLLFLDRLYRWATYGQARWDCKSPRSVDVIKGACFLLRRAALEEVGLLDERYFMYTEEVDLCYRLLQAGWKLWWIPQAIVKHAGEASSRQVAEAMYIQLYRSKVQFYRKFLGRGGVNRFKQLMRVAYGPRLVIAFLGAPFSPILTARARIYHRLLDQLAEM